VTLGEITERCPAASGGSPELHDMSDSGPDRLLIQRHESTRWNERRSWRRGLVFTGRPAPRDQKRY